jgi:hypothetical protein
MVLFIPSSAVSVVLFFFKFNRKFKNAAHLKKLNMDEFTMFPIHAKYLKYFCENSTSVKPPVDGPGSDVSEKIFRLPKNRMAIAAATLSGKVLSLAKN